MSATTITQPEHEKITYTYGLPKIEIQFDSKDDAERYLDVIRNHTLSHPSFTVQHDYLVYMIPRVNS